MGLGLLKLFHIQLDTTQSVGLLRTRDRPVAETSTWQNTTVTTNIHAPSGIRIHNPKKRSAADPRLRPLRHRRQIRWNHQINAFWSQSLSCSFDVKQWMQCDSIWSCLLSAGDRRHVLWACQMCLHVFRGGILCEILTHFSISLWWFQFSHSHIYKPKDWYSVVILTLCSRYSC